MAVIAVVLAVIGLLLLVSGCALGVYWVVYRLREIRRDEREVLSMSKFG